MNALQKLLSVWRTPRVTKHDEMLLLQHLLSEGIADGMSVNTAADGLTGQAASDAALREARQVVRAYYEETYRRTLSDGQADLVLARLRAPRR